MAALMAAALVVLGVGATSAASSGARTQDGPAAGSHYLPGPLAAKQEAAREKAIQEQVSGHLSRDAKTAWVGRGKHGQFVELARTGEDSIWTLLVQFGNQQATHNHGALGNINHAGTAGPVHNQIPQPDRSVDNTTIWAPDFNKAHYEDILFSEKPGQSTMRNFYYEASSGRYTVNGDVTDWVNVPFNEAAYGSNYCGSIVCVRDIQRLLEDGLTAWYNGQKAAGQTDAQINAYLSKFDKWDRYDQDGDQNFNEPDGYIDHFQTVHAGEGEETGGGAQGTDAIWSHRSTLTNGFGLSGPTLDDGTQVLFGGVRVGGSKYFVGDYTVEPENGGVGVFAHEFGHDLGLPDEYDTSGNTGGAENGTGWWTTWSQGSYGSNGRPEDGIGNRPIGMTAWERLQLGWLNYTTVNPGDRKTRVTLGPTAFNNAAKQAVLVNLPDRVVTTQVGAPYAGTHFYYSGTGDELDVSMSKPVTLPAGSPTLTAKVRYNIEEGWDYAYLRVSTDGGATWTNVATNLSTDDDPNTQNFGHGITGTSAGNTWVDLTADLSAYAGKSVLIGFRYWTDGATQGNGGPLVPGFAIDEIAITGQPVDGAEGAVAWTFSPATDGFHVTTGTESKSYANAYVVENRQYVGPDQLRVGFDYGLKTSPYNFGGTVGPDWTERFSYQNGVVIWYWNTQYANNNVGDHPGEGEILPVDAHPKVMHWADGSVMRPRIQSYDAAFGGGITDSLLLHKAGVPTYVRGQLPVYQFDDTRNWWVASDPGDPVDRYKAGWNSVNVPKTGTVVTVDPFASLFLPRNYVSVEVRPAK
jgi:immune inhibitor A